MVTITFDDAINNNNIDLYDEIFNRQRRNPNGCDIKATFFVSHKYTNYSAVQNMHRMGHEIAAHSITQIIESIAHASTKNQLSSTDKVKSSSPVNEIQKSPAIGSPTQNSTKKEKEENIWDRITHIEPTPIATVTAEPTRTSRPDSKSRLSDSSSTENRPEDKNRLGDELEKMRKELERVKRENQEKDQLLKQANAYCTIESNCESGNNWKL